MRVKDWQIFKIHAFILLAIAGLSWPAYAQTVPSGLGQKACIAEADYFANPSDTQERFAIISAIFHYITPEEQQRILADVSIFGEYESNGQQLLTVDEHGQHYFMGIPVTLAVDPATLSSGSGGPPPGNCGGEPIIVPEGESALLWTTSFNGLPPDSDNRDLYDGNGAQIRQKEYQGSSVTFTQSGGRHGDGAMVSVVGEPELTDAQCSQSRYRAEITTTDKSNFKHKWDDGQSYWHGFSYKPENFKDYAFLTYQLATGDMGGYNEDGSTDGSKASDFDCANIGNALSIKPEPIDGVLSYCIYALEKGGQSLGNSATNGAERVWCTPLVEGEWADFVVNFSLSKENQGYFRVWYNGQLVYEKSGLTNVHYIDSCGKPIPEDLQYHDGPHIGIYGPSCKDSYDSLKTFSDSDYRRMLTDEISVAVGPDGYKLVDPSREQNPVNNECQSQ